MPELPDFLVFTTPLRRWRQRLAADEKYLRKSLVFTQIIANFAALKRALKRRLIANSLRVNAMGGLCEYMRRPFLIDENEKNEQKISNNTNKLRCQLFSN